MKLLIIFAYYEQNKEEVHKNYKYFMKYGYYDDSNISYIFVINGVCTIELKQASNITILHRENIGYDFGGYKYALENVQETYDYYFFINSSVRGPFMLSLYNDIRWYYVFINLFKNNVKLVGCTIGVYGDIIYVESYAFMLNKESLLFLKDKIFNKIYTNFIDCYQQQEFGMSKLILENGWNINSLVLEQQDIDYNNLQNDKKFNKYKITSQLINEGSLCNGRNIHPYEVIFVKTNRSLNKEIINSLTMYYLEPIETFYPLNPY